MLTQEEITKYRSRTHALLLYPDDLSHQNAIEKITQSYDYALVLHNRDVVPESGELKKAHYHVIIRFSNQQWNSKLCKDLGITMNYCREVKNFDNALMYLMHYNDSDKAQYSIDEIKGNLKSRLKERISSINKSEGEKVVELFDYIDSNDKFISVKEFATFCAKNGYWSEFRRSATIFLKVLDEHNSTIS